MSIKDRFKMIMERENLTAGAFAESIGVAQATISHILGPRNKYPSTDVIIRLHEKYRDIDLNWLLTGVGSMITNVDGSPDFHSDSPITAENGENEYHSTGEDKNRKEYVVETAKNESKDIVKQEIIYKEKPARKITEIRIFFDDNTYEVFRPEK